MHLIFFDRQDINSLIYHYLLPFLFWTHKRLYVFVSLKLNRIRWLVWEVHLSPQTPWKAHLRFPGLHFSLPTRQEALCWDGGVTRLTQTALLGDTRVSFRPALESAWVDTSALLGHHRVWGVVSLGVHPAGHTSTSMNASPQGAGPGGGGVPISMNLWFVELRVSSTRFFLVSTSCHLPLQRAEYKCQPYP